MTAAAASECRHEQRIQARDADTGEPTGAMTCTRCYAEVSPKGVSAGRCSVCGGVDGVQQVEIALPAGGAIKVSRCLRCRGNAIPSHVDAAARNRGGPPGSPPR